MIHTIKIDDNTPNGKRIIEELRKNYKDVEFVESNVSAPAPDGYMTGQEFRTKVKSNINNHNKEFVESNVHTPAPDGYMTSDDFWKKSKCNLDEICKKHGLL